MFGDAAKPNAAGSKACIGFLPGGFVAKIAEAADFGLEAILLDHGTVEFRQVLPGVVVGVLFYGCELHGLPALG